MCSLPKHVVRAASVAVLLASVGTVQASDGAYSVPDHGIRISAPFGDVTSTTFAHPAYDGAQAMVRIENGSVVAGTDNDALTLQDGMLEGDLLQDEMAVLLMDVDFDGYLDVGVLDGVGYGGVNVFWTFFRADAERLFVPVGTVSNPERDDIMGTIVSSSRSGPFWTRDVYRSEGGALDLQFSRTMRGEYDIVTFPGGGKGQAIRVIISSIAPDPWDAEAVEDPAFHVTAMATNIGRSYFYDAPDEATRRDAYLVEGDVGRVTDATETGDWLRIIFTHSETRITTEGWMRAEDVAVIQG